MRAWVVLMLCCSTVASAQTNDPGSRRLLIDSGVLLGSPRVLALGGAYTAVAEGAGGLPSNLAALAHKSPRLDRNWDVGVGLSLLDVPIGSPRGRDFDNDGRQDAAESSRQFLFSVLMQYQRFGLGAYFRSSTQSYCRGAVCSDATMLTAQKSHTALAAAVSLGDDDFIAAFGLYAANASFFARPAGGGANEEWFYGDTGTSFDMLWRPHRRYYRVGLSVKPQVVGKFRPAREDQAREIHGQDIFEAVISPASLSIGTAWRFGDGRENFNRLSPAGYKAALQGVSEGDVPPTRTSADDPSGSLLLSAQLDLIGSVDNAVNLLSFVYAEEPQVVGNFAYFVPRIGVEHDTIHHRLRLRAGSYIEPSVFTGVNARPHLTGGAEVFLFNYFEDWAITGSFDVAPRYYNFGLSVGFWR